MNPKDLLPSDGGKSGLVIAAIVVLLSGFFLFNSIQAKEHEKKLRIKKEQELSVKVGELVQAQTELSEFKKQKEENDVKVAAQLTELQAAADEARKAEEKSRTKLSGLQRDKDQLAALVDQNASMIIKLNKKVEKLEQEKEDLKGEIKRLNNSGDGYTSTSSTPFSGTMDSSVDSGASIPDTTSSVSTPTGLDVVDLGEIVLRGEAREPAHVEHVNTMYGFIVVSAGSEDGLKSDTVLNVARNNRFIAKAVVKKVRSSVATAVILPEWTREEIRLGDQISINPLEVKEGPKHRVADFLPR